MFGLTREILLILPVIAGAAFVAFEATRRRPKVGITVWLVVVAFLPIWFGVSFVLYFQPATALGMVVLAGLAARALPREFGLGDLLVLFFFISCLAPVAAGGASASTVFGALFIWLLPFLIGRVVAASLPLEWVYTAVAVVFGVVAFLAIVEFVLDWHPFQTWGTDVGPSGRWPDVQTRGGLARSEWAFGHSIALGSSIAAAVPFALASSLRSSVRLALAGLMLLATLTTLSRVSIIGAVLGAVLTVLFVKSEAVRRVRGITLAVVGVGVVVALPVLWRFFTTSAEEAAGSAEYRVQLTSLIPDISALGISPAAYRSPSGELYFGTFASLDSQIILTGLSYGWFAMGIGVALLTLACAAMVLDRATPAVVSVVAQIPIVATVALITQYATVFWFVAGLAVASLMTPVAATPRTVASEVGDADAPVAQGASGGIGHAT